METTSAQLMCLMVKVKSDKMVRRHHQLNGHEYEQTPGDHGGQKSLTCCNPWGCKDSDRTERVNYNAKLKVIYKMCQQKLIRNKI